MLATSAGRWKTVTYHGKDHRQNTVLPIYWAFPVARALLGVELNAQLTCPLSHRVRRVSIRLYPAGDWRVS
jgi:hypothetical protein